MEIAEIGERSETKGQMPDDRCRRPEIREQIPEVRDRKRVAKQLTAYDYDEAD